MTKRPLRGPRRGFAGLDRILAVVAEVGWIPYPREEARKSKARQPGTREGGISGHAAVRTVDPSA
ncbi:hypothetical protein I2W78_20620 [Streptomyces spinoverrucosus]|uniref:hypothetical protein n=1 Tax=Streptomyces spinoverrucosus TaxID=284043 RepID=UPI0018C3CFDF|nr:hypothetical protein [Streptomyces spinoverrucosus]MBG0854176.1 hypothetical protein [Streptomyces spinoverrucosus]